MNNGLKIGVAATLALGVGGYFGAGPVAKMFVDKPAVVEPVKEPEKPKRVEAQRAPIVLTVAVDHTRSSIAKQLPDVRAAIRDFLNSGKVLQAGDTVNICQVDQHAACTSHKLPQDKAGLMESVDEIDVVKERGVNTHLAVSIEDILAFTKGSTNGIIALWTDAIEEGTNPNPEVHSPLKVVVPKREYLANANQVAGSLTDPDNAEVTTAVASNGDEFGDLLQEFTSLLQAKAQAEAEGKATKAYDDLLKAHAIEVKALRDKYIADVAKYNTEIAGIDERVEAVKAKVRLAVLMLTLLAASGIGYLYHNYNKPKLTGRLVVKNGPYRNTTPLPEQDKPYTFRTKSGRTFVLNPTKAGVECDGRILKSGNSLDPNDPNITYER